MRKEMRQIAHVTAVVDKIKKAIRQRSDRHHRLFVENTLPSRGSHNRDYRIGALNDFMAINARRKKLDIVELLEFTVVVQRSVAPHSWMVLNDKVISALHAFGNVLDDFKLVGVERGSNVDRKLRLYVQGKIDLL